MRILFTCLLLLFTHIIYGQGNVTILSDSVHDGSGNYQYTDLFIVTSGCSSSLFIDDNFCLMPEGAIDINLEDGLGNTNLISIETIDQTISQDIDCEEAEEVHTYGCPDPFLENFIIFSCFPDADTETANIIVTHNLPESCEPYSYVWTGPNVGVMDGASYVSTVLGVHEFEITNNEGISANYTIVVNPSPTPYSYVHPYACDQPVGVEVLTVKDNFLFPNPASDFLNIKTESQKQTLFIYDLLGNLVVRKKMGKIDQIDVKNLSNGTYMVMTIDDNGSSVKEMIEINH